MIVVLYFLLHGLKEPKMDTCNVNKTVRAYAVALKTFKMLFLVPLFQCYPYGYWL